MSPAERHALTIAKAFAFGAKTAALDEPTTSMLEHNLAAVLDRVRHLAAERDIVGPHGPGHAEQPNGRYEPAKTMAANIIRTQTEEIAQMAELLKST